MIKNSLKLLLLIALIMAVASGAFAKSKKKPADIYIRTAKIEVQSGKIERYFTAIGYLDTLGIYYGPVSSGLYWKRKIYTDLVEKTGDLTKKGEYVKLMVAYNDSLHLCCENEEIKKKFRNDCETYISEGDSVMVHYWTTYYNAGVEQVTAIEEVTKDLKDEQNEESKKYFESRFQALKDTCEFNMSMAIAIDSTNAKPYIGLASVFVYKGEPEVANEWLIRGLGFATDRTDLLPQIAINYINQGQFVEAIPYYEEYVMVDDLPTDPEELGNLIGSMNNLYVCYTRAADWDGADKILHRVLEASASNPESYSTALYRLGRLHLSLAGSSSGSASDGEDTVLAAQRREEQNARFDSAEVYLKQAFDIKTEDLEVAENLGLVYYVRGNLEGASTAFERATQLDTAKADNWLSLGDIYLRLENWEGAVVAYEKVIVEQPDNKRIIEALEGLYVETKNPEKRAEMKKKLKALE